MSRSAADAKVQFYALSETPDLVDFSSHLPAQILLAAGKFMNSGAQVVANAAGGEAFLVAGTADTFMKRIESETSGIYRLGVEPPTTPVAGRYLKTSVRVRTPGLSVRASPVSVVPAVAAAPADPESELRTRLTEGGTSFGVPLTVGAEMRRDPTDASRIEVDVSVDVPASVQGPVTMMDGLVDEAGKMIVAGRKQVPQTGRSDYRLAFALRVNAGRYRLRIAAADASGGIGSIEKPLSAALARVGDYPASDLLTGVTGPDGATKLVAPDAIPRDARAVTVSLELYPASPIDAGSLTVRFDVLSSDSSQPTIARAVALTPAGTARIATAQLPIGGLLPGPYTLRATLLEQGTTRGTVSISLRITQN